MVISRSLRGTQQRSTSGGGQVRRARRARALRLTVVMVAVLIAASSADAQTLQEAWLRVQQGLTGAGAPDIEERVTNLEEAAAALSARRLTPYSAALVAWAQEHQGEMGERVLGLAKELDPVSPSAFFLSARWQWQDGEFFSAVGSYLTGLWNLVCFERSRGVVSASAALCVLMAVGLSLGLVVVVQTVLYLRQLAHDALELGCQLFSRANAVVFALVVLLLPLFAGFGPVWLVAFLYAMGWPYMRISQRAFGIVALCVLGFLPSAFEAWQVRFLRVPSVTVRVGQMLDQRQVDFSTLREFSDLENQLDGSPEYHLIYGEMLRLHGEVDRARLQFTKAVVGGLRGPDAHLFLGSMSMEDGDVPRAIQHYNHALESDSRSAIAYLDLSFAYDQSRRFQEGDEARNKAREIVGRSTGGLGMPGNDRRIRYPRLGHEHVLMMVARLSPEQKMVVGASVLGSRVLAGLVAPFAIAMWVNCLLGVVVLVLRSKLMWTSSVCTRCGKVFCPRCKSSTESMSYCSQCISVFLKRDMVSIDQQTAKLRQVKRWEVITSLARKVVGLAVPGTHYVLNGQVFRGFFLTLLSLICLMAGTLWLPMFLPSAEPLAAALPMQIVLFVCFGVLWLQSAVATWYGR